MITEDATHRVSVPLQVSGRETVRMTDVIYPVCQYTVPVDMSPSASTVRPVPPMSSTMTGQMQLTPGDLKRCCQADARWPSRHYHGRHAGSQEAATTAATTARLFWRRPTASRGELFCSRKEETPLDGTGKISVGRQPGFGHSIPFPSPTFH